jgi:hypothetical protein
MHALLLNKKKKKNESHYEFLHRFTIEIFLSSKSMKVTNTDSQKNIAY